MLWVPTFRPPVVKQSGHENDNYLHPVAELKMAGTMPSLILYAFMLCTGTDYFAFIISFIPTHAHFYTL